MTVADLLDEPGRRLVAEHVPSVDPRSVRVAPLPDWYRRLVGIEPDAITLGSRVLVSHRVRRLDRCALTALLAHELAHVAQQRAGRLGFSMAYGVAYLVGRLGGRSHTDAYRAIPAERLAREVQERVLAACRD
jgi:Zn-dependent protease with chaperone function